MDHQCIVRLEIQANNKNGPPGHLPKWTFDHQEPKVIHKNTKKMT